MCKSKRFCVCTYSSVLLLFLCPIVLTDIEEYPNITLISESVTREKQKEYEMWCVVKNSTTAISWASSDAKKFNSVVSEFHPKFKETFSCDLDEENHECTLDWLKNPWKLTKSKEYYFGPILDRRWEKFRTYTTTERTAPVYVGRFSSDFHVAFSIKISHDAKTSFANSRKFFVISIGDLDGTFSTLRGCNSGENALDSTQKCVSIVHDHALHNNETGMPLNENEWRHFVVSKEGPMLSMKYAENDSALLEHNGDEYSGNDHFNMYIDSHSVNGLWKIHDYDFLYTNISSKTQLGPLIQPIEIAVNGKKAFYLCVQMFAIICRNCNMTIEFSNQENSYEKTFQSKIRNGWEEIRYVQENVVPSSDYYRMKIVTRGENGKFWAIDDVRQCSIEEVRVSTITAEADEQVSCQVLQFPSKALRKTDEVSSLTENDCSVGTFGKDCTPCELVFGEESKFCQNKKMCFFDKNFDQICQCAAGYQDKDCNKVCGIDRYGYNCTQECGHCYNKQACNGITGYCVNGCADGYMGNLCNGLISIPIFVDAPVIQKSATTYCEVRLMGTDTIRNLNKTDYYKFQISDDKRIWHDVNEKYAMTDLSVKKIKNLKASRTYYVRAVFVSEDDVNNEIDSIPSTYCETACFSMTKEHVVIVPQNVSAEITIKPEHSDTCPIEKYQVYVNESQVKFFDNRAVLRDLRPYTNYTVTFKKAKIKDLEVNFTTLEGTPSMVNNPQVTNKDSTSIIITWEQPYNPNGIIRNYTIIYKNIEKVSCAHDKCKSTEKNSTKLYATLDSLEPYSKYSIEIFANTVLPGKSIKLEEETLESVRTVTDLNHGFKSTIEIHSLPEKPSLTTNPVTDVGNGAINSTITPHDKTKSSPDDKGYLNTTKNDNNEKNNSVDVLVCVGIVVVIVIVVLLIRYYIRKSKSSATNEEDNIAAIPLDPLRRSSTMVHTEKVEETAFVSGNGST